MRISLLYSAEHWDHMPLVKAVRAEHPEDAFDAVGDDDLVKEVDVVYELEVEPMKLVEELQEVSSETLVLPIQELVVGQDAVVEVVAAAEVVDLVDVLVEQAFLHSDEQLNAALDCLNGHICSCIDHIEMVFHPNELVYAFACLRKKKKTCVE